MLALTDICVRFQGTKPALEVSKLAAEAGTCTAIIGSNGAGKSTLFNVISGELKSIGGAVMLNGDDLARLPSRERAQIIATVVQDPRQGTFENLSIFENMAFAASRGSRCSLRNIFKRSQKRFFQKRLSLLGMGLEHRLSVCVGSLSGGQRQALSLIMATLQTPQVLLLDEPTAALDPKMATRVMEIVQTLTKELNLTTLMITHNIEHAALYSDQVWVIHGGRVTRSIEIKEEKISPMTLMQCVTC